MFQFYGPDNFKIIKSQKEDNQVKKVENITVKTFSDCEKNQGIIAESYPRQCFYNKQSFVEEISSNLLQAYTNIKFKPFVADNNFEVLVIKECDLAISFFKEKLPEFTFRKQAKVHTVYFNLPEKNTGKEDYYSISCTEETINQGNFAIALKETAALSIFNKIFSKVEAINYTAGNLFYKKGKISYQITAFNPTSLESLAKFPVADIQFDSESPSKSSLEAKFVEFK